MRRAARTDANQEAIVAALRAMGCSVLSLAAVGKGCPDLLVGFRGVNTLIEVKDGSKPPSRRALTDDEARFIAEWRGQVDVCATVAGALRIVGA